MPQSIEPIMDDIFHQQWLTHEAVQRKALAPLVAPLLRTLVPPAIDAIGDWASNDAAGDGGIGEGIADIAGGLNEGASELLTGNPIEGIQDAVGGFSDAFGGDDQSDMQPQPPSPTDMAVNMMGGGDTGTKQKKGM